MVLVILAEGKDADLFARFSGIKFLWEENSGALGRGVEPSQSSIFMEKCAAKAKGDWLEHKTDMLSFLRQYCQQP